MQSFSSGGQYDFLITLPMRTFSAMENDFPIVGGRQMQASVDVLRQDRASISAKRNVNSFIMSAFDIEILRRSQDKVPRWLNRISPHPCIHLIYTSALRVYGLRCCSIPNAVGSEPC